MQTMSSILCKILLLENFPVDGNFKAFLSYLRYKAFGLSIAVFFPILIFNFKKMFMKALVLPIFFVIDLRLIPDKAKDVTIALFPYSVSLLTFGIIIQFTQLLIESASKITKRKSF